jgi:hypothetical protein
MLTGLMLTGTLIALTFKCAHQSHSNHSTAAERWQGKQACPTAPAVVTDRTIRRRAAAGAAAVLEAVQGLEPEQADEVKQSVMQRLGSADGGTKRQAAEQGVLSV